MSESLNSVELEKRLAAMEAALGSISEGLLICDSEGRVVRANRAALRVTGLTASELLGQLVTSEDWNRPAEPNETEYAVGDGPLVRVIRDGEECVDCPIELTLGSTSRILSLTASAIVTLDGTRDGAVAVIRDLTSERRENQAREEFLSLLSHELRAPLTVVSGYAQLLGRKLSRKGLADEAGYADLIKEQVSRMSAMASDLVELGRFEAGVGELHLEHLDLAETMRFVVSRVRREQSHSSSKHELSVDTPADLPVVHADPRRLDQIVTNLLSNSLKYSPHGGPIMVSAVVQPGEVRIEVADQGVGIPDEEKEKVFGRSFRGTGGRALAAQGLGLGLYICKLLVAAHGGRIGVESGPSNTGSTFWFTLPFPSTTPPPPSDPEP